MAKTNSLSRVLLIIAMGAAVFCLSAAETQAAMGILAQISQLQKKIFDIQMKLAIAESSGRLPAGFRFEKDLKFSDYNIEVAYLQMILKSEGVFCSQCRVTGFFGRGTYLGLIAFQEKYLEKASGSFDNQTREKINSVLAPDISLPAVAGAAMDSSISCFAAKPGMPALLFPKNNESGLSTSFNLVWSPLSDWGSGCPDNKKYQLQIDDNPDFSSPLVEVALDDLKTSYFISPGVLSPDSIYHWRVRAENGFKSDYVSRSFGVSFTPAVDLRVNDANGPLTINYGNSIKLSWFSSLADKCEAFGSWQGQRPVSGSEEIKNLVESTAFGLSCSGVGGTAKDEVEVNVLPQPVLELNLKAIFAGKEFTDSFGGLAPVNKFDLAASIFTNVSAGSVDFKINCNDDGVWEKIESDVLESEKVFVNPCVYSQIGTYNLRVRAEKGGLANEKSIMVAVYETEKPDLAILSIEKINNAFLAKVINRGPAFEINTTYLWLADYVAQVKGVLPGFKAGEERVLRYDAGVNSQRKIELRLDVLGELL